MQSGGFYATAQNAAPVATPTQQASNSEPYVLHVYANLVQVPMLALDSSFKPLPLLTTSSIHISLDSGPVFHPTQMHLEGEEPISIAMVLDASGDQDRLFHTFAYSAEEMAKTSLRPHDRLTVFATDCKMIRSSLDVPVQPLTLQSSVVRALSAEDLHNGKNRGSCGRSLRLWDTAALAVKALAQEPGRRMLLIVSDGDDRKSGLSWSGLRNYANDHSIAIFGLRDLDRFAGDIGASLRLHGAGVYYGGKSESEAHFQELCESTGGLILTTPASQLTESLERLMAMMRGRYILEFPRPSNSTPGRHSVDVTLPGRPSYVVVSGVAVAMPDKALEDDPTTIHSAPSPAVLGNHPTLPGSH